MMKNPQSCWCMEEAAHRPFGAGKGIRRPGRALLGSWDTSCPPGNCNGLGKHSARGCSH